MTELQRTENNKTWCVYMHVNKINDKKYIGVTGRLPHQRWGHEGNHYRREPVFYGAIKKYGWDGFEHVIVADNLTEQDAKQLEIELIALYKTNCFRYTNPKYGYNCTDGGDGKLGYVVSEETRQKLRASRLGKKLPPETRTKISESNKGRVVSEETRKKLSESRLGENNPNYGKRTSEETRQKLSNALSGEKNPMYGKKRPLELKNKLLNALKESWQDPSFREKMSNIRSKQALGKNNPKAHPIVQLTLDNVFVKHWDYIKEAAIYYKVSESSIRGCCSKKQKTSCGYKWMYKEDYEKWIKNNVL